MLVKIQIPPGGHTLVQSTDKDSVEEDLDDGHRASGRQWYYTEAVSTSRFNCSCCTLYVYCIQLFKELLVA